MCGRYTLSSPKKTIIEGFQIRECFENEGGPRLLPRYNIAPTQSVLAVIGTKADPHRQLRWLHWGLIPHWAKDPGIGSRMINARAQTAAIKPAFRAAMRHRRCLILADGFYEWQRQGKAKQPYYFHMNNRRLFAFAGLWEHWVDPAGDAKDSCTILTTNANDQVRPIHDRMPLILCSDEYDLWLNPNVTDPQALEPLLDPYKNKDLVAHRVSRLVNRASVDNPDCIKPIV